MINAFGVDDDRYEISKSVKQGLKMVGSTKVSYAGTAGKSRSAVTGGSSYKPFGNRVKARLNVEQELRGRTSRYGTGVRGPRNDLSRYTRYVLGNDPLA